MGRYSIHRIIKGIGRTRLALRYRQWMGEGNDTRKRRKYIHSLKVFKVNSNKTRKIIKLHSNTIRHIYSNSNSNPRRPRFKNNNYAQKTCNNNSRARCRMKSHLYGEASQANTSLIHCRIQQIFKRKSSHVAKTQT